MKMLFILRFSAVVIGGSGDLKEVRLYVQSAQFVHRSPLTSIQGIVIIKEALSHKEPKPRWFSRSKTALLIALSAWRR